MTPLEIADYLDKDKSLTSTCSEAATLIRKQHAAIKQLRQAIIDVQEVESVDDAVRAQVNCRNALLDTENI